MLPNVVFDRTEFVKYKITEISNNFKQNIDKTDWKTTENAKENPYQPMDFKNSRKNLRTQ